MGRRWVLGLAFPFILFVTVCFALNAAIQNFVDNFSDYLGEFRD